MFLHRGRKKWTCKSPLNIFFAPLNGAKHNLLYTWHPKSNQFVSQITYIGYLIPHWKVFLIPINFSRLRLKCLVRYHWDSVIKSTAQGMVHLFKQHHLEWKSQGSPSVHYMHCLPPSLRPFWHHLFYRWYSSTRDLLDLQGPGIDRVNGVSVVFDASCGICPFWILFLFLGCSFLKQEKTTWSAISRFQSVTHHCELYKACDFQDQESCVGRTHNISRGFFLKIQLTFNLVALANIHCPNHGSIPWYVMISMISLKRLES